MGLSAAISLAHHGIRSVLVERHPSTTDHPKARAVQTRSMELFRQWGCEEPVKSRALGQEYWQFRWCETMAGEFLGRVINPEGEDTDKSPAPRRIMGQDALEEALREHAESLPLVELRFRTEMREFEQTGSNVVATVVERESGAEERIESLYMVGADGARSAIRRRLGIELEGPAAFAQQTSIYFEADLRTWSAPRPADIYYCTAGDWIGVVNGSTRWLAIVRYHPELGQSRDDYSTEYCAETVRRSVGVPDVPLRVINRTFWEMAAQVARTYRGGRIFLAGDAAHRMAPTGGFGMNTGIQDAHNLAWKLAAVIKGEGGPALLDTYEEERAEIARRNADWSAENAGRVDAINEAALTGNEEGFRAGVEEQQGHLCSEGLSLGLSYASAGILPDGTPERPSTTRDYLPTARPGSRAPHLWLHRNGDRISTLDLFGSRFVLLTSSPGDAWRAAAAALPEPRRHLVDVHDVGARGALSDPAGEWLDLYELHAGGAVLVRPDGHVAWRVPSAPANPAAALAGALSSALVVNGRPPSGAQDCGTKQALNRAV